MKTRAVTVSGLALMVLTTACSGPTTLEEASVEVRVDEATVEVRNDRGEPVFVRLLEREAAAEIDAVPCPRLGDCPIVRPGRRASFSRDRIVGVEPDSREAILRWWAAVPDGQGGFEDTEPRALVFPLR